jgi:hypothetical protein
LLETAAAARLAASPAFLTGAFGVDGVFVSGLAADDIADFSRSAFAKSSFFLSIAAAARWAGVIDFVVAGTTGFAALLSTAVDTGLATCAT